MRSRRAGGAADRLAARMSEDIEIPADDEPEEDVEILADPNDEPESGDDYAPDYSHEDEPEPELVADPEPDALGDLAAQLAELQGKNDKLSRDLDASELISEQTIVSTGLSQARADLAAAEAELERASAAGEHKKVAAAHKALALAAVDVREFEAAADEVKQKVRAFREQPAQPQRQPAGDPFEAAISTMSDVSKAWCRANKADLQRSPGRGNLAKAAHIDAIENGVKPDTPEYFAHLNKAMGYEAESMPKTTSKTRPTGKARVAAPGGSRAAPANGGREEVTLSRAEVEIAKSMGMTTKAYALQKKELIKNANDPSRSGPRYSQHSAANRR